VLKLLIICFVAVWILGLFLGRKRRVIKNTTQLIQLILWMVLVFMAATSLPRVPFFREHLAARAVVLLIWFAASYKLSFWVAARLDRKP